MSVGYPCELSFERVARTSADGLGCRYTATVPLALATSHFAVGVSLAGVLGVGLAGEAVAMGWSEPPPPERARTTKYPAKATMASTAIVARTAVILRFFGDTRAPFMVP